MDVLTRVRRDPFGNEESDNADKREMERLRKKNKKKKNKKKGKKGSGGGGEEEEAEEEEKDIGDTLVQHLQEIEETDELSTLENMVPGIILSQDGKVSRPSTADASSAASRPQSQGGRRKMNQVSDLRDSSPSFLFRLSESACHSCAI